MEKKIITVSDITSALDAAGMLRHTEHAAECGAVVTGVTYDSKQACEGTAFVCKGAHFRKKFLKEAIDAGASCYISESDYGLGSEACPEILVTDIRAAMPVIAESFYGRLSDKLEMVGVTGTKGKSTTTYYMRYILDDWLGSEGKGRSAVCSGIYNYDGVIDEESHLTTPEILELYTHMDNALRSGIHYLSMEVSSQGLKYNRLDGITFAAGAFLNIGRDHISDGTQSYAGLPVQQDIAAFFAEKDADDSLDDITADDDRTILRAQILALTDLQRKDRLDHIRFPDTPDHGENLLGLHVEDSFKEILDFGLVTSHNSRKYLTLSPSCLAHFQGGLYCRFQDLVGTVSKT